MTVPVQVTFTTSIANGATTVFPYGFKIAAAEDLAVTVDGVRLTSGYTVSGVGNPAGGNVTITVPPANGAKVVRYLAPILKRDTDYQQFGDWLAAVVNSDFDRIWLTLQTLQQNDIRSLKLPLDTATDQVTTQDAAARVGKLVSFDASGNMTLVVPANLSLQTVSAFIATLLDDANAATALATLGAAAVAGSATQVFSAAAATSGNHVVNRDYGDARYAALGSGVFYKADPATVAFTKTGAGTASIKAGTRVDVAGTVVTFASATAITMPTLAAGTDYAIWVKDDATIEATTSFSSAPGAGNWRKIGGFHYAPGGNAAAQAGGDTTPAINAYSLWDLKFRPACYDPRGMTLVADSFWSDIYLLGVDHLTNGTSKYNVSIADGSSPPKIPTKFGGTGSNAYSTFNWWEANEVLQSWGKRSPNYDELAALAYGTTEATSGGGTDVPTTGVTGTGATSAWNIFTSRWGAIQASGCMWIWGAEFGGGAAGAAWAANTVGRGSTYQMENSGRFGGYWGLASDSGSRASVWNESPSYSNNQVGARGVADHYIVD